MSPGANSGGTPPVSATAGAGSPPKATVPRSTQITRRHPCMTTSFTAPRCGVALPKSPTRLRLHARHALQAGGYTPPMVFAQPCGALKGACAQRCSTEIRPRPPAKAQQTDMGSPPWRAERSSLKRDRSQPKQPEPPPLRSQVDPGASDLRRTGDNSRRSAGWSTGRLPSTGSRWTHSRCSNSSACESSQAVDSSQGS